MERPLLYYGTGDIILWNDPYHTYGESFTSVSDELDQVMGKQIPCFHTLCPVSRAFLRRTHVEAMRIKDRNREEAV